MSLKKSDDIYIKEYSIRVIDNKKLELILNDIMQFSDKNSPRIIDLKINNENLLKLSVYKSDLKN
ncbi:MAG: hypothetical protein JW924_05185 [Fusobacteriaceae bacterium]|nr:hypothetical protein [Fusobacteriaceae bacterium]